MPECGHHLAPLLVDGCYFLHAFDTFEPSGDQLELVELDLVYDHIGDFEVVLQICNSQSVASHEISVGLGQQQLQFLHRCQHFLFGCFQHIGEDWLLSADSFIDFKEDDTEEGGAEEVLVPGEMLIDLRPFLRSSPVVEPQLLGELLAEVDEDGIALTEFKVAVDQEGDLPEGVETEVLFGAGLVLDDVECDEVDRQLRDVQEALDCAGGLAAEVPIESQRHAEI